jgi:hypothetical protein
MVVVPLSLSENEFDSEFETEPSASETQQTNWVGLAAGGALVAGGLLLLTGQRRAGLVAAVSGATLALLDDQKTVRTWWSLLPAYIDDLQRLLDHVEGTVGQVATQRDRLRRVMNR